jgi:PAS domain S-box-containing protein
MGRPILDDSGRVLEYVGVIMDTTEQKRAAEKLVASEQRFRQLAEAIPHHVWTFLPDGSVGYYNDQLVRYTGLSAAELKTGGWAALHPEDVERAHAAWRHAWASGEPFELEQRFRGRDGRYRRFLTRTVAVRDEVGRIREWFGTDTDVEALRQAEQAVNQARAELAHVNRAMTMGELTASIAHELNQPLAAVVTNANACERWLAAPMPNIEEANDSLRRITRDAMRASEVISRIRGLLTRRSSPKTLLRIDEVVRDVSLLVQTEARAKNVQVQIISAQELPAIVADRVQLQQVILNLVMNAIEAMSAVEGVRSLEVRAQAYAEGVQISVHDSGTGVDPRIAHRIFDAFFTTKTDGMGMGLAISRSIIEAHGGRLWASSSGGPGATFQFTLPPRPG